ncbi:unnamed protein product [Porites lobata]|uniref:Vomeronasal type-1 receptor n=1 Tax=Porites lobata TaxID=104759 RepID=A0ABN8PL99_9CNID|nr:unnamed protein product [Porites lobata]
MVAAIVIFQLLVSFVGPFAVCEKTLTKTYCSNDSCKDFLGVIFGSLQTAYIFSWFISAILLLHFMKCHRPTVIIAIVLWCFQLFLGHFVFRDRTLPKITITVNNRFLSKKKRKKTNMQTNKRLYSIISYFFFFYNVLVGLFSCLLRIFKGTVLGVLFLGRIDRTVLMQGFQTWDPAFVAYLGFINVLVAHSHPVVLMFCQLLINRHNNRCFESENSLTNICSLECESSYECGSADEKFGILSDKGSFKTYDAHYTRNLRNWRLSVTAVNRWQSRVSFCFPSIIAFSSLSTT